MLRKIAKIYIFVISSVFGESYNEYLANQDGSFSSYKKNVKKSIEDEEKAFIKYQKQLDQDLNNYQQIYNEERKKIEAEITKIWGDKKTSSPKVLIEYSDDLKTRKIINFETGTIIIERVDDKNINQNEIEKELMNNASEFLKFSQRQAYERDKFINSIDNKFSKIAKSPMVKSQKLDGFKPILGSAIFGHIPSQKESEKYINSNKDEIEIKENPNNKNENIYSFSFKIPENFPNKKALEVKSDVYRFGKTWQIEPALILAIIHSESNFNPMAQSPVPAYGLMQIVPRSAGIDAYNLVYGERKLLSAQYLFNSRNNIELGTAYLHLLKYKYLDGVTDTQSRLYCMIAGYNTGTGNVSRAFIGDMNIRKAIDKINNMSSDGVYNYLLKNLPYNETKVYLKRVMERYEMYKKMYS